MLSNLRNRKVAGWTATALAASSLAVAPMLAGPALATSGTVELSPNAGTNYGAFSDDAFTLDADINRPLDTGTLAFAVTVDDIEKVKLTFTPASELDGALVQLVGVDDIGEAVSLDTLDDTTVSNSNLTSDTNTVDTDGIGDAALSSAEAIELDFAALGATTILIYDFDDQTGGREYTVAVEAMTSNDSNTYGDGVTGSVSVTSWMEIEAGLDYTTVDASTSSATRTINFYDPKDVAILPKVERFAVSEDTVYLNDSGQANLAASLSFGQTDLNLDQVDIADFEFKIGSSDDTGFDNHATEGDFANGDRVLMGGYTKYDDQGKITMYLDDTGSAITLAPDTDYILSVSDNDTDGVYSASAAFSIATSSTAAAELAVDVTSTGNVDQDDSYDTSLTVRAGTEALTYTVQVQTDKDTAIETPSILVYAAVTSGSYITSGSTLSVTGGNMTVDEDDRTILSSAFTDADGQAEFTVTHTGATKDDDYNVTFFVLDSDDAFNAATQASENSNYDIDYVAPTATTLVPAETVLGGDSVTVTFDVEDQFEQGTNLRGTKATSIHLTASNTDNLDTDIVVSADGTASYTFDNYVALGAADVITAAVYTGSTSSRSKPGGALTKTMTLYNAAAASNVQVPEEVTGKITYRDYVADGAKVSATVPNPDNDISITGTIVDADGSGVPGASVTISAPGMQIQESGSSFFYQDEHTITASAAGVFTVLLNAHIVNTDGVDVTFTSGDNVGTTTVKTYLPDSGVTGDVLDFQVALPDEIVMNTTYAVTATLKDKWGNPIKTSGSTKAVTFAGAGSLEVNGVTTDITKQFDANGESLVFVRSVKDIAGPGSFTATLAAADYTYWDGSDDATQAISDVDENTTDTTTTVWDETVFVNSVESVVDVKETATPSSDAKVNAGSFKGYVAVYAKGYEGQRLSAKIGNDWVVVPALASNFERIVDFTGAGVDIAVRIYIDRVLMDTINLTTK